MLEICFSNRQYSVWTLSQFSAALSLRVFRFEVGKSFDHGLLFPCNKKARYLLEVENIDIEFVLHKRDIHWLSTWQKQSLFKIKAKLRISESPIFQFSPLFKLFTCERDSVSFNSFVLFMNTKCILHWKGGFIT